MGIALRKKCGNLQFRSLLISTAKIVAASTVMALVAYPLFYGMGRHMELLRMGVTVLVAAAVYGILILFAQIPEVRRLVNHIYHNRMRRKHRQNGTRA